MAFIVNSHDAAGACPQTTPTPMQGSDQKKFIEYHVSKTGLSNLRITPESPGKNGGFFVETATYTPSKPDVTLHAGEHAKGKVLGAVDLKIFSGHYTVTLGVGKGEGEVRVEKLDRVAGFATRHQFEFDLEGQGESGEEARRRFVWRHPGDSLAVNPGDLELVEEQELDEDEDEDEQDGELVLAQYLLGGVHGRKDKGRLLVREGYGSEWEVMVLLTGMALVFLKGRE
jgi:hypothetical protein